MATRSTPATAGTTSGPTVRFHVSPFFSLRLPSLSLPLFFPSLSCPPGRVLTYSVYLLGRTVYFLGSKTESLYFQRKNPRKIAWTVLYRRKHKKGLDIENKKRRTRRTQKFTRAIEVRCRAAALGKLKSAEKKHEEFSFILILFLTGPTLWPLLLFHQGVSEDKIRELRNQKPEVRAAARQNAAR